MKLIFDLKSTDIIDVAADKKGKLFITRFNTCFQVKTKPTPSGTVFTATGTLSGVHFIKATDYLREHNYNYSSKRGKA